ncbi:MAG: hypothetical protein AVO33_07735, partial [delta proteobacterium ML8_F1]
MAGINQVFVLFMLIVVGYFIRKKHLVSDAFQKDMSNFVMKVTMPFFALMSVYTSMTPELFKESVVLVIIAFGLFGLGIVFSYGITKILKIEGMRRDVLQFTMVFPNVGFMGIPVMKAVYGNSGVIYSVFFVFTFNLLLFSFGVYLMKRHCDGCDKGTDGSFFRRFLRGIDPVLYALFAGLILMALKVRIPTLLEEVMVSIGNLTSPLSMMFIGFILASVRVRDLFGDYQIYLVSIVKLAVLPLLFFVIFRNF